MLPSREELRGWLKSHPGGHDGGGGDDAVAASAERELEALTLLRRLRGEQERERGVLLWARRVLEVLREAVGAVEAEASSRASAAHAEALRVLGALACRHDISSFFFPLSSIPLLSLSLSLAFALCS